MAKQSAKAKKARNRDLHFEARMSDTEALMWNVEKDPWLNPSGSMISILDRPINFADFERRIRVAVAEVPRLRERVMPGFGRFSAPSWAPDPEFDLRFHLRHISLPAPGSMRDLLDLATRFSEDPFDRTRPLWIFTVIDGVEGGKGALFSKLHHTITDGIGAIRLSERYMEGTRGGTPAPEVDLEAIVAAAAAAHRPPDDEDESKADQAADLASSVLRVATKTATGVVRRQADAAQKVLGELGLWVSDTQRAVEFGEKTVGGVKSIAHQLGGGVVDGSAGSPLWATRSRHRHLEPVSIPLEEAKLAAKRLGGSVNDLFVTGAVAGVIEYHSRRDVTLDHVHASFVISTRTDHGVGGNSFSPTPVMMPGGVLPIDELFVKIRDLMADKRDGLKSGGSGALGQVAGIANLLPTSVITKYAREQAAKMDFATSNLRGAPFPLYVSGAKILRNVVMGPVAGTAFNLTTMSYNGSLDMGLFVDPVAVDDPAGLRECLEEAYQTLLAAAG